MDKSSFQYQKFPPGWDCKYDQTTGNCYYINYLTRAVQLEDPRLLRYRQFQNERSSTESIPVHPLHSGCSGSPYHVFPSNNLPAMRAFQTGGSCNSGCGIGIHSSYHTMSASPLLSSRGHLEMSPLPFIRSGVTPQMPRLANTSRRSTIQETSFTNVIDTDAVVAKIQNTFPTASENHIRLLLKKYYNREAVVISALQVEKHPVTMPGPYVTPPAQRHLFHNNSVSHMTPPARRLQPSSGTSANSRTASPMPPLLAGQRCVSFGSGSGICRVGYEGSGYTPPALSSVHQGSPCLGEQWRSSPKPHSSPKMKLRYMKNIFPKADEMLLLDILTGADDNVQTASEKLILMGYAKRDCTAPPKPSRVGHPIANKSENEHFIPLRPKEYTEKEKEALEVHLKNMYPELAERIITMALESVNYAEDRAMQILKIVVEEGAVHTVAGTSEEFQAHDAQVMRTMLDDAAAPVTKLAMDKISATAFEKKSKSDEADNSNACADATTKNGRSKDGNAKKPTPPSIHLITPTTATTQIILSNLQISLDNESQQQEQKSPAQIEKVAPSVPSASSPFIKTASSSSVSFHIMTTKHLLSHLYTKSVSVNSYLHGCNTTNITNTPTSLSPASILDKLKFSRPRHKADSLKNSQPDTGDSHSVTQLQFKSMLGRIATIGHNSKLAKGSDESLLLADYVTWNGANPDITNGHKQLAVGANKALICEHTYTALGHNGELCKGSKPELTEGSIYAQLATGSSSGANIKCN